jgi:hypothetical protein
MKFQFKTIIAALAITFACASCSNDDDDATNTITGEGSLKLEFDNVYHGMPIWLSIRLT